MYELDPVTVMELTTTASGEFEKVDLSKEGRDTRERPLSTVAVSATEGIIT